MVLACAGEQNCKEAKSSISAGFHQDAQTSEATSHESQHCLNHCDHRVIPIKNNDSISFIQISEKAIFSYRFNHLSADLEGPFRPPLA